MKSTVDGLLGTANQTLFVLGCSVGLHLPESRAAHSAIVVVSHCGTDVVADKQILLVVAASEKFEHAWIRSVADRLQDHVVSLLDRNETNVLHSLHKREGATVCLACLFVQMLRKSMLVIQVVACPELH